MGIAAVRHASQHVLAYSCSGDWDSSGVAAAGRDSQTGSTPVSSAAKPLIATWAAKVSSASFSTISSAVTRGSSAGRTTEGAETASARPQSAAAVGGSAPPHTVCTVCVQWLCSGLCAVVVPHRRCLARLGTQQA